MTEPRNIRVLALLTLGAAHPVANLSGCPQDEPVSEELQRIQEMASIVKEDIEELRGKEFKAPVQIELSDQAGFLRYARERLERTEGPEVQLANAHIARLLGLVPGDQDLNELMMSVLAEQVGGFYDPATDSFYVMEGLEEVMVKVIIAHEFTHALDDQHYDLDGHVNKLKHDSDAALGYYAVIEGSGTELMGRWAASHLSPAELLGLARAQSELPTEALVDAPPCVWKPLMALYFQGQSFLKRQERFSPFGGAVDNADIDTALERPPLSTEQVLHPAKYWDEEQRDEPRFLGCDSSGLPEDWEVLHEDTFGELQAALICTPFSRRTGMKMGALGVLGLEFTNDAASGWGGDRILLMRQTQGGLVLHLRTVWDSIEDAREFHAALGLVSEGVEASKSRASGYDPERSGIELRWDEEDGVTLTSWSGSTREAALEVVHALEFQERERSGVAPGRESR